MNDKTIFLTEEELEDLGWDEKTLLELEQTSVGWIIKQSKVAASKFLGFRDNKDMDQA